MWKNRFNRKNNDDENDDAAAGEAEHNTSSRGQPSSSSSTTALPDKAERLALYRFLEAVVEKRCEGYATLTDPRSLGVKSFFRAKNVPPVTSLGIRKRQLDYLRLHVLPTLAAALLLEIEDIQVDNRLGGSTMDSKPQRSISPTSSQEEEASPDEMKKYEDPKADMPVPELSDPVACITLLMSNMILVSKGNYDARVRNILKAACVPLLKQMMTEEQEIVDDRNKARALYFLTEQHTKQEKKKQNNNNNDKKKKSMNERLQEKIEEDHIINKTMDGSDHQRDEKSRVAGLLFWKKSTTNRTSTEKDDNNSKGKDDSKPGEEDNADDDKKEDKSKLRGLLFWKKSDENEGSSPADDDDGRQQEDHNILRPFSFWKKSTEAESGQEHPTRDHEGDTDDKTRMDSQQENGADKVELDKGTKKVTDGPSEMHQEVAREGVNQKKDSKDENGKEEVVKSTEAPEISAEKEEHEDGGKADRSKTGEPRENADDTVEDQGNKEKSETSDEQDNIEESEESTVIDWERTTRIPKLSSARVATQQFEAIERAIATDILKELVERDQAAMQHARKTSTWKDNVVRGLKITTVGVVVGSLFAVTGGLAAPGLVAAIAALGVHSTAVFAALTTTTALASMFGVVGGGLGAYRMSRRVQGLSEWRIRKETTSTAESGSKQEADAVKLRGLHSHVCVSGWLSEKCDFQRPFGVKCQDPVMPPLRALQRFFCVHDPKRVKEAAELLKGVDEKELWAQLKGQYGKSPDDLLPLQGKSAPVLSQDFCTGINNVLMQHVLPEDSVGTMKTIWETNTMLIQMEAKNNELLHTASFISDDVFEDEEENERMQALKEEALRVAALARSTVTSEEDEDFGDRTSDENVRNDDRNTGPAEFTNEVDGPESADASSILEPAGDVSVINVLGESTEIDSIVEPEVAGHNIASDVADNKGSDEGSEASGDKTQDMDDAGSNGEKAPAKSEEGQVDEDHASNDKNQEKTETMDDHLEIIWDWQATYSGEMYTLSWETNFLLKLCRVATLIFMEMSDVLGKQVLTNALVGSVVAIPSALFTASMVIDDPYQIISLRSKVAGVELAHCLLTSDEHRPISLVGFSFGARLIFDCLLELARHQLLWQEQQKQLENADSEDANKGRGFMKGRSGDADRIEYVREPASIVEDVILIGMPRSLDREEWIACREIVGGRLVNCYNRKDWIVSYMINVRCFGAITKTCGTHPVESMDGVENYEVSDFAATHDRYLAAVPQILHKVGYSQPTSAL